MILDDVNAVFKPASTTLVLGPPGSGKVQRKHEPVLKRAFIRQSLTTWNGARSKSIWSTFDPDIVCACLCCMCAFVFALTDFGRRPVGREGWTGRAELKHMSWDRLTATRDSWRFHRRACSHLFACIPLVILHFSWNCCCCCCALGQSGFLFFHFLLI